MSTEPDRLPSAASTQPVRTRTVVAILIALLGVGLLLLVLGGVPRMRANHALAAAAKRVRNATPREYVVRVVPASAADLTLAGTTQAFQFATVYARTSGYVTRWLVDIGEPVRAGQLLAEIASPEVEQELKQAHAELRQAKRTLEQQMATRDFAHSTRGRYLAADVERAVAKEMVDQSGSALKTAEAAVAAAQANVASNAANARRLRELTGFQRVVAPFDGTVTRRNVDEGALITAGSPTSTAAPGGANAAVSGLFDVAQIDMLRVFVNVPQSIAASIKIGMPVRIVVRGHAGEPFSGAVTRTANAIDPATRTLLVEIDIPNESHALFPGMFVNVSFSIAPAGIHWRVPATAVVIDDQGTRVAIVDPDNKIRFQSVVLARDFGDVVDIQDGLRGDETLVKQPRVSLREGQRVQPLRAGTGG